MPLHIHPIRYWCTLLSQELLKKRRYGRLQKVLGDYSLLAGSPGDAMDHYQTAVDLGRASSDFIWAGASLEGLAHARVRKRYR